jgi:hypothetical protein
MNRYRFRIYYEWQGPTVSDIFAEEKTPDEIERAFERFPTEVGYRISDQGATLEACPVEGRPNEIILVILTSVSEVDVMKALIPTLQDWRLFGEKLAEAA